MEYGLPQAFADEIKEDAIEEGMSLEALAKMSTFKVPKGIAKASLVLMARRINNEADEGAPTPKKTINRLSYMFWKTAISPDIDAATRLAYFKEAHDRLDGKAGQAVELTGKDGNALILQVSQSDTNVL